MGRRGALRRHRPNLLAWMGREIGPNAFVTCTVVLLLVSAGVVLTMKETEGKDLLED